MPYNRRMTNPEIVVPFALPPADYAKDLLAVLNTPALARLLSRGSIQKHETGAAFAPALAHERWLARVDTNSPPLAHSMMQALGMQPEHGYWFVMQPASFHIARDHLVLTDWRQLAIAEDESRQLFHAAESLCAESGLKLLYGNAQVWFLRADHWHNLTTCSPDTACGHNIDIWLPKGEGERDWRRLQNEIQMLWHSHAVNAEREACAALRINTVWLWGGSADDHINSSGQQRLAQSALGHSQAAAKLDGLDQAHCLLDQLIAPALAGDWSQWLACYAELDQHYFAPRLKNLIRNGQAFSLVLTDSDRLLQLQLSRHSMRKFWCKPSLKRLIS